MLSLIGILGFLTVSSGWKLQVISKARPRPAQLSSDVFFLSAQA